MFFKKYICAILVLSLTSLNIGLSTVSANEIYEENYVHDKLRFSNISRNNTKLSVVSGEARVTSTLIGQSKVTKTSISAKLQRNIKGTWKTIDTWTVSSNSKSCNLSKSKKVSKGYSYRILATAKAYKGSLSETNNIISNIVKY